MSKITACSKGSTILVTGANGGVTSHIIDQLLLAGFRVKGTVRDEEKKVFIEGVFHKRHCPDLFSAVVIPDVNGEGACDGALQDCTGIVHAAHEMPALGKLPDFGIDFEPAVQGIKHLLQSAAHTPSIKRFVYTNTLNAAGEPRPGRRAHLTTESFNTESEQTARGPPLYPSYHGMLVYFAAKAAAEKAAWSFVRQENPGFVFNSVLPNYNVGPNITLDQPRGSIAGIMGLYYNNPQAVAALSNEYFLPPQQMVDVRDTARLHLAALTQEDVQQERLFSAAEEFSYNRVIELMESFSPEGHVLPKKVNGLSSGMQTIDDKRSIELLRRMGQDGWSSCLEAIKENCLGEEK